MIRGVVLDVDDTLYLERDYVRSGFRAVAAWCHAEWGVSGVEERAWELFEGGLRGTTLTNAMADCGIIVSAGDRRRVVDLYRSHAPRITMLDDARDFVERHAGLVQLGVVTDGPAVSQRNKCQALGLFPVMDPIIITADLGTSKPDPAVFLRIQEQWLLGGPQLVYVADNPEKDFLAPSDLGWASVRVRRAGSLHHDVPTPEGVSEMADLSNLSCVES